MQPTAIKTPAFTFVYPGRHTVITWPKYKMKECWALILCLMQLRGVVGPVIVHNWWSGTPLKFTREFQTDRAAAVDPRLMDAPIIAAHGAGRVMRVLALMLAAVLMLLPVRGIVAVTKAVLPKQTGPFVVYADGHLSGFALVLAARAQGALTVSLHHGLYRNDDRGSLMMIRNFVADKMCLWDESTRQSFRDAGVSDARLLIVGAYGFGALSAAGEIDADLVFLCPPYDVHKIGIFRHLESVLPESRKPLWSLHPMLRAAHADLPQEPLAAADVRPLVAICGDSGALMDALARHIPIVTVSDRPLAAAHLTLEAAGSIDAATLAALMDAACANLAQDRCRFGFEAAA